MRRLPRPARPPVRLRAATSFRRRLAPDATPFSGVATFATGLALLLPAVAHAQDDLLARSRALFNDTAGVGRVADASRAPLRVVVRDPGPGVAGDLLRHALERPHLALAAERRLTLGRAVRVDSTLVVVGDLYTAATVRGDVIVLGQLYLRPGATIEGRAISIGGGVHNSTLARVRGGELAFRDIAPDVRTPDGRLLDGRALRAARELSVALDLRHPLATERAWLPGIYGVRVPTYDRINGLSLAVGPELALDTGRVRVDPMVTWRTHLGTIDPGLRVTFEPRWRTRLELDVGRGTFSNDAWIRPDLLNTVAVLATGRDLRNWWRADRAELALTRRIERGSTRVAPFVGLLAERAWSVARDTVGPQSVPFSVFGRDDLDGVRRFNPAVTGGRINSALAGATVQRDVGAYRVSGVVRIEAALDVERGGRFVQTTVDGSYHRPILRARHLVEGIVHGRVTSAGRTPSQRYAWLGGPGTIQTLPILSRGGDQFLFAEGRYTVPVDFLTLPFVGVPSVAGRVLAGATGVGGLPAPVWNVGPRLTLGPLRADFLWDPAHPGNRAVNVGLGFRR